MFETLIQVFLHLGGKTNHVNVYIYMYICMCLHLACR